MFLGSRLDNVKDMTAKGRVRRVHGAMRADLLRRIKESNNDVEIAEAFDVPLLTVKNLRTTGLCHPNPW
jgi:hypothetical protein